MKIAIIIVNYNLAEDVAILLESIDKHLSNMNCTTIVVDNNSPDRNIEILKDEYPEVRWELLKTNYGFGHANNYALNKYEADYYLLLNPDTRLVEDCLTPMIEFMESHKEYGVIGPKILYEKGGIQESAMKFPNITQEFLNVFGLTPRLIGWGKKLRNKLFDEAYYETDFVYGSCFFMRKAVLDLTGGFDTDYFLFTEEVDLCYRLKRDTKYKVAYLRTTVIEHASGKITNKVKWKRIKYTSESKLLFWVKHYTKLYSLLCRILNAASFFIRFILVPIKKKRSEWQEHYHIYWYLTKLYLQGKPIVNKVA